MRRSALSGAILAIWFVAGSIATAGVPQWETLQHELLFMREHYIALANDSGLPYSPTDGIWALDPAGSAPRRRRHFFATTVAFATIDNNFEGNQGFLSTIGDRVLFEAYPYQITFDALSWRMISRIPAANGLATGWALQGPYLDHHMVAGTGLQPGLHGIARCDTHIIINTHFNTEHCTPILIPGTEDTTIATDEHVLLWAPQPPGEIEDSTPITTFTDSSWGGDAVLLSYDQGRRGFWRGTELHAQFHPIQDGALLPATIDLDLDALPFRLEPENGYLSALYYQEPAGLLYGVLSRRPNSPTLQESLLFSLDPSTGTATRLDTIYGVRHPAFTFATIRDTPDSYEQIIPIVADTRGAHGEHWRTDLWLYNPATTGATVTITRLRSPTTPHTFALGPHASHHIPDVLLALGGGRAADAIEHDVLVLTSEYHWGAQVVAQARIWTRDTATTGSFGQAIPAVPSPVGYSNHSVPDLNIFDPTIPRFNIGANALAAHIDLDHREPGRFRHNIGIVNTSDDDVTLQLIWTYQDNMDPLEQIGPRTEGYRLRTLTVPARGLRIENIESLFPNDVAEGWVPRLGVFGPSPAIIWYSMVDNLTGDATFVPFTSFTATTANQNDEFALQALAEYRLAFPVVAHTNGVGSSTWQTDLYGFADNSRGWPVPLGAFVPAHDSPCARPTPADGIARFLQSVLAMPEDQWRDTLGLSPPTATALAAKLRTIYPDVVRTFPGCETAQNVKGGLEILAGSWFSGFSRTYTTRADGGTYGAMLPLYPPGGWPVQHFAGLEAGPDTRINIGLFNGDHDHAITHRVTLYDAAGELVAEREITIAPLDLVQERLTQLFSVASLPPGSYGLTVVSLDDPNSGVEGHSWAYVSIIDNITYDPINLW